MLPLIKEGFLWAAQLLPELLPLLRQLRTHPDPKRAIQMALRVTAHEEATDAALRKMGRL